MGDFLADDNPCGRALVHLVSRGNAVIAELLRLKDYIPSTFRLDNKQDQQKYGDIISDFLYFKTSDDFERKIEKNPTLQDLDTEFRDNNVEILNRFFLVFESVHKYATDINQFVEELEDGIYIQQNLENLFYNGEGKQLLCEMLYLYGVMLLLLDIHIDGMIRERLLVSYYRYCAQHYTGRTTVDDVCKLMRSTGFGTSKRPQDYPVDYFKRIQINEDLITMIIGHLRTDDIYNQISAYPSPEHRSTALSSQAVMLFVCLFFNASILNSQSARMREIVDKYFPDNWVISFYMGSTINLIDIWDSFKAAKVALGNTLEQDNIHTIATNHMQSLKKGVKQTQQYLKEGALTEERVFEASSKMSSVCRDCNVSLRWLILHTIPHYTVPEMNKRSKQIREQVLSDTKIKQSDLLQLLLNTAEFELNLKELIRHLIDQKEPKWNEWKNECVQRMEDLSDAFSGEKPLTRIPKNENLQGWFKNKSTEIESLNIEKYKSSSRKILQLLKALEEVQGFHRLSDSHQVSEYIRESSKYLKKMVKIMAIKEDVLVDLQIIGDIGYAWIAVDNYTKLMQERIKSDPSSASKLRATFLKLSSALETPLLRINQAGSEDLVSVSQYYSQELVSYIRKVLHIIPETMFLLMAKIIHLQTNVIKEMPTRLEKDKIKEYAQLDDRTEVARFTHDISVLSEGMLKMKSTLVGIVKIDPKKLLEDGIRRELVKHLATALHTTISFNSKSKSPEPSSTLKRLSTIMDGYKRSFEYIQDYIGIHGLKIWQEEVSRIIGYNVEMECNSFLRNKIQSWQSIYQNKAIPIPDFPKIDNSVNFIGRLLNALLKITDPKTTVYVENSMAWFDFKTQAEVMNFKVFNDIKNSIGVSGLTGLDRLICFMIVTKLQNLLDTLRKEVIRDKMWTDLFTNAMNTFSNPSQLIEHPSKVYGQYLGKLYKLPASISESILQIGQLQILRRQIFYELEISCKFDSKQLYMCLETFNEAMMNEIKARYAESADDTNKNMLLKELSTYLEWAGIGNPYAKIYITTSNLRYFPMFMFFFTVFQLSKLQWQKNTGVLMWKKCSDPLDGFPFVIGLQTIFRQFHPNNRSQFTLYMSQYLKSYLAVIANATDKTESQTEIRTTLEFLYTFIAHSGLPKSEITDYIPETAIHLFETLVS
ncbi:WASH complex subunit 5 [Planococcus citri]|uniref:WASH complex subunit 5 n=1 Tax=Planococcus citri TaxID=170843 RepID=UPI0031F941E1